MNRIFAGARPASGVPAFVLATVVVAGSAAAQDGPVMLTGLPLGPIDTGAQNGPVLEAGLPAGTATAQGGTPTPQGGGVARCRHRRQATRYCRPKHPAEPRRQRLQFRPAGHRNAAAGGQSAVQPAAAAGPGRSPGFVRPAPRPRRSRQSAIPPERGDPARGNQRLRRNVADPARQFRVADHRRAAGAIRLAHSRNHRHPDQDRDARARR